MFKKYWKFAVLSFLTVLVFFVFVLMAYTNLTILRNKSKIYFPADVPTSSLALVFGGGLNKDGTPNDMAMDRIIAGVALYKSGKVEKIMITGDDGRRFGNEVDSMKKAAIEFGMPDNKILLDRHGYRTYESCYREAKVFGLTNIIAVSQAFHLPRIIYMCNHFGINTVGVASDLHNYGFNQVKMEVREAGARLKAWWQIVVTRPLPLVVNGE